MKFYAKMYYSNSLTQLHKEIQSFGTEECKEMEKALLENNGNTARHIPGPLPLRDLSRVDSFLLLSF